ncbi:MAG: hypothetical protein VW684_08065 [Betaproteobacteria bacterium]
MVRLSKELRRDLYVESLRKRLRHYYTYGESHPSEIDVISAKLDGFLEAGALLQICSKEELQQLIDAEHLAVFGMSRLDRSKRREEQGLSKDADWSGYDAPTSERISRRSNKPRGYTNKQLEVNSSNPNNRRASGNAAR